MDITPIIPKGRQLLTGYGEGGFKVNHEFIASSLIVFAERSVAWRVTDISQLKPEDFQPVFDMIPPIELLLLGTGSKLAAIDPAIKNLLRAKGIAFEIMDTGAACRTYNVLMSEERRVAAALVAI